MQRPWARKEQLKGTDGSGGQWGAGKGSKRKCPRVGERQITLGCSRWPSGVWVGLPSQQKVTGGLMVWGVDRVRCDGTALMQCWAPCLPLPHLASISPSFQDLKA